jgi:hypothetical protein
MLRSLSGVRSISSSMPATEIPPRGAAALLCGSLTASRTLPAKRVLPSCRARSFTPIAPRVEELPRRPALAGLSRMRALSLGLPPCDGAVLQTQRGPRRNEQHGELQLPPVAQPSFSNTSRSWSSSSRSKQTLFALTPEVNASRKSALVSQRGSSWSLSSVFFRRREPLPPLADGFDGVESAAGAGYQADVRLGAADDLLLAEGKHRARKPAPRGQGDADPGAASSPSEVEEWAQPQPGRARGVSVRSRSARPRTRACAAVPLRGSARSHRRTWLR